MNIALALIFLLLFQPLVAAYLVGFHLERLTEAEYPLRRMILWQMLLTAIAMVSAFVIAALVSLPFALRILRPEAEAIRADYARLSQALGLTPALAASLETEAAARIARMPPRSKGMGTPAGKGCWGWADQRKAG